MPWRSFSLRSWPARFTAGISSRFKRSIAATQQAEKHRCDNKLSSIVVEAAQRSATALVVELHALVAAALENDLAVQHGHHEVAAGGDNVGDAPVKESSVTIGAAQ